MSDPYQLIIKSKTLSEEARIIRAYSAKQLRFARNLERSEVKKSGWEKYVAEHRAKFWETREHRLDTVRVEARATYLARAFLTGMDYVRLEGIRYSPPDWVKIEAMVLKYGATDAPNGNVQGLKQNLEQWKQAGDKATIDRRLVPKPQRKKVPHIAGTSRQGSTGG